MVLSNVIVGEQYTKLNAATARLLTLVKPAETLARWQLTESKGAMRNSDVNNHIA